MKQWNSIYVLTLLPWIAWPGEVLAHGSKISYQQTQAIQIQALAQDNQPMKNAQVIVYAPDEPSKPWSTGKTDSKGSFTFIPDQSRPGNWEVKISHSGHGDKINIPVVSDNNPSSEPIPLASSQPEEYTPLQTALMAVTGVWGFIGTALFFSRRKVRQPIDH